MKTSRLLPLLLAVALSPVLVRPAHAFSRPVFNIAAGTTLGADGAIAEGGGSVMFSPMWPVTEHSRFGVAVFADDIGTTIGHLYDPNDHTDLGLGAFAHRWTWGGAWRGDIDVLHSEHWGVAASGTWGWWRVEDDARGNTYAAASAVGVGMGGVIRHTVGPGQTLGLAVRWQRLFAERNASYRRVEHYATAALEWGWSGKAKP